MDPIVMAVGTALVKVMATETWNTAKEAVVRWWRKARPEQADQVGKDLDELRSDAVAAGDDTSTQEALTGAWRLRLHRLLNENPDLRGGLEQLLSDDLLPRLSVGDQSTVAAITQTAEVKGNRNTTVQAGRDANVKQQPRHPRRD
ncbi:hypothetical protein [Nocardia sp. NPDC059239]|uniref:hypothetical protein n=1 Tax=unclassified Nocardia TaxID=2637762 RepID=UPI0036CC7560